MDYLLLDRFRTLFEDTIYRHRNSSLGDSVAVCLPEDLYRLHRSTKLNNRIDATERVTNLRNQVTGVKARRGDGTFGELIPGETAVSLTPFAVARGRVATVEIGAEVKILAKAMIKQIDRVTSDLQNQRSQFLAAGGTPITVGIVGINHAARYVSYEGDKQWPTDGRKNKHPIQEAPEAERRLLSGAAPHFDEFLILRFRATNESPHHFQWVDEQITKRDYGAVLTRVLRKYEARF